MKPTLLSFFIILGLGLLVLGGIASSGAAPAFQELTPTPTIKPSQFPPEVRAGDTNGIALLGILIFSVIVLAIASHLREMRAASQG